MIGPIDEAKAKAKPQTQDASNAAPKRRDGSRLAAASRTQRSNMPTQLISLKVLLPFQVFAEKTGVSRIVAETREGSFGLLPHRLDCVAALAPGF